MHWWVSTFISLGVSSHIIWHCLHHWLVIKVNQGYWNSFWHMVIWLESLSSSIPTLLLPPSHDVWITKDKGPACKSGNVWRDLDLTLCNWVMEPQDNKMLKLEPKQLPRGWWERESHRCCWWVRTESVVQQCKDRGQLRGSRKFLQLWILNSLLNFLKQHPTEPASPVWLGSMLSRNSWKAPELVWLGEQEKDTNVIGSFFIA